MQSPVSCHRSFIIRKLSVAFTRHRGESRVACSRHFGNYTRVCHLVILFCFANIARTLKLVVTHITDHFQSLCSSSFVFRNKLVYGLKCRATEKNNMKLLHDVIHTHTHLDQDSDVSSALFNTETRSRDRLLTQRLLSRQM